MSAQLFAAIRADRLNTVQSMLQEGANCNSRDPEESTPLMVAASLGHLSLVRALLAYGADVNAKNPLGWTALMKAIYNHELDRGFPEIVSALIEAGSEIETEISYGTRPLMLAAGYGQAEVIEVLLAAGVNVGATNEGGLTARTMAEYKDYVQVINQLYEAEMNSGALKGACSPQDAPGASVIRFASRR